MEGKTTSVFGNKVRVRVCGLLIENEKILLVKHKGIQNKGDIFWAPPGGGVSFLENTEDALKREFLEETGLSIEVEKFLFFHEFIQKPLHAIELFFEVKQSQNSNRLKKGIDPELSEKSQIINSVERISISSLKKIDPKCKHQIFALDNWSDFENLETYYKSLF